MSCDGRFVFIQLQSDGETRINGRPIKDGEVGPMVRTIMEPRAERVVYLVPESQIEYSRFVKTLAILNNSTSELHVAVLAGQLRDEYFKRDLTPCDIVWP